MPPLLITLPVRDLARASSSASLLTLSLDGAEYRFAPGQAVMLGAHRRLVRKPYSIASSPADARDRGVLEFLVASGSPGQSAPPDVSPGGLVDVEGPFGSFVLPDPVPTPRLLLLAGGTGIAPLRSMWRHVLASATGPRVTLAYSVRTLADIAFADEIADLVRRRRLDAVVTVSRQLPVDRPRRAGRLDLDVVRGLVGKGDPTACVCGPPGFVADVTRMLMEAGLPADRVLREGWA